MEYRESGNGPKGRRNLTDFVKLELAEVKADRLRKKGREKYERTVGRPQKSLSTIDNDLEPKHNTRNEIAADLGWMYNRMKKAQGGTGANQYKEQRGHFVPSAKTAER